MVRHPNLDTILAEYRAGLEAIYGDRLDRVVLFGSQARGDAEPDSDIDVMIVLHGDVDDRLETACTSEATAEVCLRHNVLVSRVIVSHGMVGASPLPFFENARCEGVAV